MSCELQNNHYVEDYGLDISQTCLKQPPIISTHAMFNFQNAIRNCGVNEKDLIDLKFYENRSNGQSKGFALGVFAR